MAVYPLSVEPESRTFKQGVTRPPLTMEVLRDDGNPLNFSDVTNVYVRIGNRDGRIVDEERANFSGRGAVTYEWRRGDLDVEPAVYDCDWVIRFSNGDTATAPTEGTAAVIVERPPG